MLVVVYLPTLFILPNIYWRKHLRRLHKSISELALNSMEGGDTVKQQADSGRQSSGQPQADKAEDKAAPHSSTPLSAESSKANAAPAEDKVTCVPQRPLCCRCAGVECEHALCGCRRKYSDVRGCCLTASQAHHAVYVCCFVCTYFAVAASFLFFLPHSHACRLCMSCSATEYHTCLNIAAWVCSSC